MKKHHLCIMSAESQELSSWHQPRSQQESEEFVPGHKLGQKTDKQLACDCSDGLGYILASDIVTFSVTLRSPLLLSSYS